LPNAHLTKARLYCTLNNGSDFGLRTSSWLCHNCEFYARQIAAGADVRRTAGLETGATQFPRPLRRMERQAQLMTRRPRRGTFRLVASRIPTVHKTKLTSTGSRGIMETPSIQKGEPKLRPS